MNIFSAFLSAFILSLFGVALVLMLSKKYSWFDPIDERKIHTGKIPRLGGVGFTLAFVCVAVFIFLRAPENHFSIRFFPVTGAMLLILVFGIIDDFHPLRPKLKFLIQLVAALFVVIHGYIFHRLFDFPLGGVAEIPRIVSFPLTFLWIVGLTNAMNLIDGVDGLAGGLSMIVALFYALIFSSFDNMGSVILLCVTLAGAVGGFLTFNLPLPKAKIFMGDSGSQFLGFMLACLPLLDQESVHTDLPLPFTAALLLIPVLDTTAAVWRRIRDKRRIDSPDRAHIHHKLMNLGFNAKGVIGVLYSLQIVLGLLVFFSVKTEVPAVSLALLGTAYALAFTFFGFIHFTHKARLKRKAAAA